MRSARASDSKKGKKAWLPRLYEHRALSARATVRRKRLVTKALRNAGAIYESNGLFFRVKTTRKHTGLLKCE